MAFLHVKQVEKTGHQGKGLEAIWRERIHN
jgi:hypothetical protein